MYDFQMMSQLKSLNETCSGDSGTPIPSSRTAVSKGIDLRKMVIKYNKNGNEDQSGISCGIGTDGFADDRLSVKCE